MREREREEREEKVIEKARRERRGESTALREGESDIYREIER